jgi:hypothetical protein
LQFKLDKQVTFLLFLIFDKMIFWTSSILGVVPMSIILFALEYLVFSLKILKNWFRASFAIFLNIEFINFIFFDSE